MAKTTKNISPVKTTGPGLTAKDFIDRLTSMPANSFESNTKYFKEQAGNNMIMGVRMASLFQLAKEFTGMPVVEIQKLLKSAWYEGRMGAVCIMDFQARNKKLPADQRKQLYDLYLKNHKHIDNWDMVDRGAPYIIGGYLFDKDRAPLYNLAKSKNIWERRTAIVSTYFFIRQNDIEETFKIGEMLLFDKEELINKAVGSWIREAGKRDVQKLLSFLDKYAATMPRVTLRYAIEKLDNKRREKYMDAGKNTKA